MQNFNKQITVVHELLLTEKIGDNVLIHFVLGDRKKRHTDIN